MLEDNKQLILIGYSGHAFVVGDTAINSGYQLNGYLDREMKEVNPFQINYLGNESEWLASSDRNSILFPAVGDNMLREKMVTWLINNQLKSCVLIDPTASVSKLAEVGTSTLIAPHVRVNALAQIGVGCIINTNATIEHECIIGDFTHVAPGVVLAGNVVVGKSVFIGANAVIKQGITIGNNVIIGAGAVVLNDIKNNETWVGNPARKLK
ncbi:MAG: acetyltransferase [Bacteroidota bacterium]